MSINAFPMSCLHISN